MKNKWLVVNVASSRGIPSLRTVVASFATLTECEYFIDHSAIKGDLAIRAGV